MAEEQAPEPIPSTMTGHLPNLASMCDPDFLELVLENGQILIRGLSSKITKERLPCSGYFSQSSKARIQREGETSTANRSKDGVVDSMFDDPLSGLSGLIKLDHYDKNKINSYPNCTLRNSLHTCPDLFSELYEDGFNVVLEPEKKCYDEQLIDSNIGATRLTSSPGLAGAEDLEGNAGSTPRSSNPFDMMLVDPTNGSKNISSTEKEGNFMAINMKPILPNSGTQKESLPDEQSEAVGYKDTPQNTRFPNKFHGPSSSLAPNTAINGDPGNRKSLEQMVASSSVCSREASNCPIYTLKRRYEDTDLSENAMEEPVGMTKAAPARGSKGAKRKRKAEVHNLSEWRRRDKINKKMRALKELIPNCNKVDKASMLDEAIEYLKTLQLQVQMMSMGTGVYMPPIMLPSAMQHMNAQHLAGYSPMAVGMGMRMQMGLGFGPAQFPISLMSGAAALPGITEAQLNMLGFPGQALLMSMSGSPFVSLAGKFSSQSVQAPAVSQAAAFPLSTSKDSNPTH